MATYQDSPWWVAENLTNQQSFRLSNFWSNNAPSGYQTVHAGSQADWNAFQQALSSGQHAHLHNIEWNVVGGPYATEKDAQAAIPGIQAQAPAPGAAQQVASGVAGSIVNDMLKPLFNKNIWIRVGEVLVGLILLGIGVNALFKGKPMQTVTKTAGKVAPLALAG
jgi:hypothetical protein